MKTIFPKEIVENTVEVHRFKHTVKSKIIYTSILVSVVCFALALPYFLIDIYSSSLGVLKPQKERNQISSLYSGSIESIFINDNNYVQKGDTLLIIDNKTNKEKSQFLSSQLEETLSFVHDLRHLSNSKMISRDSLYSFYYQKEFSQYLQKLRQLETSYTKNNTDLIRQEKLYNKGVIAKVAYENSKYDSDVSTDELNHFKKQQRNQWQATLTHQQNKEKELKSNLLQNRFIQNDYIIKASVSGTIQNLKGLEVGNFIIAGNAIADISPDTNLIVECYISPSEIGLLRINNKVKFQIDAFNYNQWGMATGQITSINNDISVINNTPMFKVLCSIDQKSLQLKNGFVGHLKKGMTLNARFFITTRSAFDLLYDKIDDWFNPSKLTKH